MTERLDSDRLRARYGPPVSGPWDTSRGSISAFIVQAREDVLALLALNERLKRALAVGDAMQLDVQALAAENLRYREALAALATGSDYNAKARRVARAALAAARSEGA